MTPKPWSATLAPHGAGGEPVDFARTVLSHGVADLPPNVIAADGSSMETVLTAGGRAWVIAVRGGGTSRIRVTARNGGPPAKAAATLIETLRRMFRLNEDLSQFYEVAARDATLGWVTTGAGRMLRSPTVFEDLVKTICTTNCTWSATERMVGAIVGELGTAARGAADRRTFPTPEQLAEAGEDFFKDVARAGYRGAYLRSVATDVAEGRLDLEQLNDPELSDMDVTERLLALPGVGPYATAHMMMLIGRYRPLILDSWTRPTYRRLSGRPRVTDKGIVRAFRPYRQFAGLAFWLTLTESWVTEPG